MLRLPPEFTMLVGAMLALVVLLKWLEWTRPARRRKALLRQGVPDLFALSPREFERLVAAAYEAQGYRVQETGKVGDWGADVVLEREGHRIVVQAKRWTRRVGVRAVQEAVAAKPVYKAAEAWVVATSTFTNAALELAKANGVRLVNRTQLERLVAESQRKKKAA